jgi:hypothetical protein
MSQEEDAAIQTLLNAVGTCPIPPTNGGRKRRGGAGEKRGFPAEVPPPASTLPTTGLFSTTQAPKTTGPPPSKKTRTSAATVTLADKTAGFVDATRDFAGAVIADNLFAVAGVATVSVINPAAAAQTLGLIKLGATGALGCVTPPVITALIVGTGLMKIVSPYISFSDIQITATNALVQLKNISDKIGNYLEQQKTMSKKAKQLEINKSLTELHKVFVQRIEDIKNNKESTEEAEADTLTRLTNELEKAKEAPDTPMVPGVPFNPAPPTGPLNKGGRRTKKRGVKRRNTRRSVRKPLFKY